MVLGFQFSFQPPPLNPLTKKAQRIPVFNPIDRHGRVFFFSWMGFMVAFWAWYTFPPLLTHTIKHSLHLTPTQISNSNILSLVATLLVRLISGWACDRYGPRLVFASILLLGSIPIGLAPLITNVTGLYIIRFFIGILGGSFVPCQVWCTAWFDKNVVGTANAVAGGWGNAGGGVTYFVMPAVFDSLVGRWGMSEGKAWRVTFVVPLVCLLVCGLGLMLLCEDTPGGRWRERDRGLNLGAAEGRAEGDEETVIEGVDPKSASGAETPTATATATATMDEEEKGSAKTMSDTESTTRTRPDVERGEVVVPASTQNLEGTTTPALTILLSPQTIFHILTYFCSFGSELAINSVLSSYFLSISPSSLTQTSASNYAAIFGFLNFFTRPLGGLVSDLLYKSFGGASSTSSTTSPSPSPPKAKPLWARKLLISLSTLLSGTFLLLLGLLAPTSLGTVIGLVILAAIFIEAGNGANFGLIPFVWPERNGVVSGVTGAGGNLGGVLFALVFRFVGGHGGKGGYEKAIWILGVVNLVVGVGGLGVRPVPGMGSIRREGGRRRRWLW
ncbi:putative nitrate transport protein crnA [Neurospora tetraspora]|uniref:Nitrate transport protein crnA n=1 Tax=Neurospora tetraspora TaxID=94610 RepID=A0AAE0JMS3_9PEZI|nr:putative nitrate transport protein crnA [Neurospora tetraspora]